MVAVNLYTNNISLLNELEFKLLSPEDYDSAIKKTNMVMPSGYTYVNLPVPIYDGYGHLEPIYDHGYSTGCGPASGVMIARFYNTRGYTGFPSANQSQMNAAFSELYNTMGTFQFGTFPHSFGSGFVQYAQNKGYYNFNPNVFSYEQGNFQRYLDIVNYINNDTPLGGMVLSYQIQHYYAGYIMDTSQGRYELICRNPHPTPGMGSNDWIGFYATAWNNFIAIAD